MSRFWSALPRLLLLFCCFWNLALQPTFAADSDGDSIDDAIDVDDDGDGLIEITTLTELDHMRNNLSGSAYNDGGGDDSSGCGNGAEVTTCNGYELMNDLDFNTDTSDAVQVIDSKDQFWNGGAGWVPIDLDGIFTGISVTFEGNGYTISNLYINNSTKQELGLFGQPEFAKIRNLTIDGPLTSVTGSDSSAQIGLIAGYLIESSVENCHAHGAVASHTQGSEGVGVLVGVIGSGFDGMPAVSDSSSSGSVTVGAGTNAHGGGLVGRQLFDTIEDSYSSADVTSTGNAGGLVGGIFSSSSTGAPRIFRSFATGDVHGGRHAGGLLGTLRNSNILIENAFATGNVSHGSVFGATAGGLLGKAENGSNHTLRYTYATGMVSGSTVGGLIGDLFSLSVVDSYFDTETGLPTSDGGTGKTTAQLQCPTANNEDCESGGIPYANWPGAVWDFGLEVQYPALIIDGVVIRDSDGDGLLDVNDSDDDGDGEPDVTDVCPFDPAAANINTDGDARCDENDLDDDNDGYSDVDENSNGGQSNPLSAGSTPPDNDTDFVSDFNDPDDDNDGYTDVDELSNGGQSNPFNAGSTPPDQDGDFVSNFNDDDDDGDLILDVNDNCPLDPDAANLNNDGDALCDTNDPDDDNDGELDGDDNCPLDDNPDQANNDNDALGDVCDPDDDNDGDLDGVDNCPFVGNSNQSDQDNDGFGDFCDVDADGDRLIELRSLADLDAMRLALDGSHLNGDTDGCSDGNTLTTCNGFELSTVGVSFDFNTDTSDAVQVIDDKDQFWNGGMGWIPVGTEAQPFTARFNGNHLRIQNLYIDNTFTDQVGFFGALEGADIQDLRFAGDLTSVSSTRESARVGTLAGLVINSNIEDLNAKTTVTVTTANRVGGLVGEIRGSSTLNRTYVGGSISAAGLLGRAGGLAGAVNGEASNVAISNSYSYASVSNTTGFETGGLVGISEAATLTNTFAYGVVTGTGLLGQLVANDNDSTVFNNSYFDGTVANANGHSSDGGTSRTTDQLQCPTSSNPIQDCAGAADIYSSWNGQGWHFGASFQYPVLVFQGVIQRDTDGDGIFDTFESDPDGDGFDNAVDNCDFDPDLANINSDDDDRCDDFDTDDDNDGYLDTDEIDNGTSTTDANYTPPDNDGDFISDLNDNDDDNDGNPDTTDNCVFDADIANLNFDGDELCDTNDPDDDNDGVSDEREIAAGLNPFDPNDLAADSDGDGFTDGEEAQAGSGPFNADQTPLNAGAGFNQWRSTGPNGGAMSILWTDPGNADIAYAGTNDDIYHTTDQGQTWQRFTDTLLPNNNSSTAFFGLAVDPNDSNTVFVVNRRATDRVFKTADAGQSWQPMETGLPSGFTPQQIFSDPFSAQILYLTGAGSRLAKYSGGTWTELNPIPTSNLYRGELHISSSNSSVLYLYSNDGVFVSSDAGENWVVRNNGLGGNLQIRDLVIDPANANIAYVYITNVGFFKTTDQGLNWARVDTGTSIASFFADHFVIDPNDGNTLYLISDTVYKSTDAGVNWVASGTGVMTNFGIRGLAMSADDSNVIYLSESEFGAYVSSNAGQQWSLANSGFHRLETDNLKRVPGTNELVFATRTGSSAIHTTTSAGARWDQMSDGIGTRVFSVAIDPTNPDIRYAGGDSQIFKTTDGGETWVGMNPGVSGAFYSILVDPDNTDRIYATSLNSGFVRTINGGTTWEQSTTGLNTSLNFVSDLAFLNGDLYLSANGNGGAGVYKSVNKGSSWEQLVDEPLMTTNTHVDDLTADVANNRIYASTGGTPRYSDDAGATWENLVGASPADHVAIDPEAPEIVLKGHFNDGFARSADFGVTWQDMPGIVRPGLIVEMATGPAGSSVIYAGSGDLGVFAIELANDLSVAVDVIEAQIVEGVPFTYQLMVTNNGQYDESRVSLEFALPVFAPAFDSATPSQGSCSHNAGIVSCDLGLLAIGQSAVVDVITTPNRAGNLNSRVLVDGYLSELTPTDSEFVSTFVSLPDTDGDTIPDVDDTNDDGDNFLDVDDNCPLIVNNDQADFDGDGQGDPCDPDDDNDGISDAAEIANGLNPRNPADALLDPDNDGLNNRQEIDNGTDLNDPDTDDDGTNDGDEVANGTNPRYDESMPFPMAPVILLLLDE